ncbi:MAG: transglycosylase domain-containing protein, partial [Eubacteriales bacterium]
MNYGKFSIKKKQQDFASRKVMKQKRVGIRWFKTILIIAIILCIAIVAGVLMYVKNIIDSAPEITPDDVSPVGYSSFIVDEDGTVIQKLLESGSNRIYTEIENIPQDLQDAFVAIEDSRFYDHNGVDIIGIMRAGLVGITSGSFSEGASTITQQLIKNSIFDDFIFETDYDSIVRKIQEIYLAMELEEMISKDTILENYLNTINMGQSTLGVQAASLRYFDKDVSELTLSECAVLACITNSPEYYNPITYPEYNMERREKVLDEMLSQGYITQAEYDEAMDDTEDVYERIQAVNALYTESVSTYTYFTDATIEAVLEDLQEELGYTYAQAKTLVYSGGITIVSTQDLEIQEIVDTELADDSNFPSNTHWNFTYALTIVREDGTTENYWTDHFSAWAKVEFNTSDPLLYSNYEDIEPDIELYKETLNITEEDTVYENLDIVAQPQVSFVIMDQSTGQVKAIAGGRGEKTSSLSYNRADEPRQPGSTFKILAAYAPAIDT